MDPSPAYPRPEYPRPDFFRPAWQSLNGPWTVCLDPANTGFERGFSASKGFDTPITVPFCIESPLSGLGHTDFVDFLWYHRTLAVPRDWRDKRILLHFGAVDYFCDVYLDGKRAGRHWGGSASFSFDLTELLRDGGPGAADGETRKDGEAEEAGHHLVVYVQDRTRSTLQPTGKQSHALRSSGCHYTRVTGIWQSVWMEAVPERAVESVQILPAASGRGFTVVPRFFAVREGDTFTVEILRSFKDPSPSPPDPGLPEAPIASASAPCAQGLPLSLDLPDPRPWSPENPHLYGVRYLLKDRTGEIRDEVSAYAGLRRLGISGNRLTLNGEPLYLRFVLDQGYYPDGIWTAPTDAALKRDIEIGKAAGFNGARLHQKAFEPRYHYWADRLGYLTWAESPSWGLDMRSEAAARNFLSEWKEIVVRDRNHPSIIAWTPFNETSQFQDRNQHPRLTADAYDLTRDLDPTRPVNDASGWHHVKTDLWSVHCYEQDAEKLRAMLAGKEDGVFRRFPEKEAPYAGQPYILAEFGGAKWTAPPASPAPPAASGPLAAPSASPGPAAAPIDPASWGYGETPASEEDFYRRLEALLEAVLQTEQLRGYCYTQLVDVEQERNGLFGDGREPKFDPGRLRALFSRLPPAYRKNFTA